MPFSNDTSQSDQERDANSFLVELDKGLRSGKVGEQCEAIVRFPGLFEKHPFPILINAAFLKLADVFREGTNLMRLCVLKVAQQSEKHLDKIINVDEFLQRIYYVIHSNDPLARAITLRTLGSFANVVRERKNVHHSIITGMDSHDPVELQAAIYAAEKIAAQSKSFAESICGKISRMIEGLATPYEIKLELIPIFQHMHHDIRTSCQVRTLCVRLLPSYPSRGFVLVTLRMLSQLSAKSLIDLSEQVDLLISYTVNDPRCDVKVQCLKDLIFLAKKAPHIWSSEQIQKLCEFATTTPYEGLQMGCLEVLIMLASTVAVNRFEVEEPEGVVLECCTQLSYHPKLLLAARGCQLYTLLALHNNKSNSGHTAELSEMVEAASVAVENVVVMLTKEQTADNLATLKEALKSVVRLCDSCTQLTDRYVDTIISSLSAMPEPSAIVLCECLAAISSRQNDLLYGLLPDLIQLTTQQLHSGHTRHSKLIPLLVTLLFQACVGEELSEGVRDVIALVLGHVNSWTAYRIGRQAARFGHHQVAHSIFSGVHQQVWTGSSVYWLSCLQHYCYGETCLKQQDKSVTHFLKNATKAEQSIQKALTSLRAASSGENALRFQEQYLRLRCGSLQAHCQVVKACCSFQTSPPPAIATSLALTTGHEIHRCGHVVSQLQKCGKKLDELHSSYKELYQSAFDADHQTLVNIQLLQTSCQVLMYVLDTLLNKSQDKCSQLEAAPVQTEQLKSVSTEHRPRVQLLDRIFANLKTACEVQADLPLSYQHIECLKQSAIELCQVPICVPRFFFQKLQSTKIKLVVSPPVRLATDQVSVHYDTHLSVKVEGVLQHGQRPGLFRAARKVQVCVHSAQVSKGPMVNESKVQENPPNRLSETVEPHNDYFSTQFLLSFPVAGIHTVHINTQVLDEEEEIWNTGPAAQLQVKSYDEGVQRQQQQQYAAQRQQQRSQQQAQTAH